MNVVIGAKTDLGRRSNNEDYFAVVDVRRQRLWADGLLVIADGMGGRRRGEHAAQTAVETIQETMVELLDAGRAAQTDVAEALVSALRKANSRVYELSRQDEDGRGMGTTCVVAVVQDRELILAHAGDSRAYLLRGGMLRQLTDDHSYVAEQVRIGAITEEGARTSRFRNVITRAVGIEPTISPDVSRHEVQPGDVLMLCTDGLSNTVVDSDIAQTLEYAPSPQAAADRLVQLASRAGGKDNITTIVARLEVGNATAQMRPEDLPHLPNGAQARSDSSLGGDDAAATGGDDAAATGGVARRRSAPGRAASPRTPGVGVAAAIVLFVLLAAVIVDMSHVLLRDGYHFRAEPPFIARPARAAVATTPAPSENLAKIVYQLPVTLYVKPVQGGFLSLDPADGSLTVVTLGGRVVRLSPQGAVLSQSPPPTKKATTQQFVFPTDSDLHAAVDPQGNFYIADLTEHEILKFGPDLIRPLGRIPGLQDPGAIAAAPDGTIYVIDNERLKVIRPSY